MTRGRRRRIFNLQDRISVFNADVLDAFKIENGARCKLPCAVREGDDASDVPDHPRKDALDVVDSYQMVVLRRRGVILRTSDGDINTVLQMWV